MAKILYLKASPRGSLSHSCAVADAFVEAYRAKNPRDEIVTMDLFAKDLMPFDGFAVQAKYTVMHGASPTAEEKAAWGAVEKYVAEFKAADAYVFAVPMWNFGVPYRLKQYLDILMQPGLTFSFTTAEGYKGLVTGKRAFVAYARGGEFAAGTPAEAYDLQKKYLELALGFMGITDVRSVIIEPTLARGPEVAKEKQTLAVTQAREFAITF